MSALMKTGIIIVLFSALFIIFSLVLTDNLLLIDRQVKVNNESALLLLSGSILIVLGILTRKRLIRK